MSIDYDLAPTENTTAPPAAGPVIDAPTASSPARGPAQAPRTLNHTEGGLPAVPLLLITSNTAVAGMSAAAIAAGPAAAVGIMAGTAVTAAAATVRARAKARGPKRKTITNTSRTGNHATPTSTRSPGAMTSRTSTGGTGKGRGTKKPNASGTSRTHAASAGTRAPGRISQVKALRKDTAARPATKKQAREQTTAARRHVADSRRAAKADAKTAWRQRKDTTAGTIRGTAGRGKLNKNTTAPRTGANGAGKTPRSGTKPSLAARTSAAKTAALTKTITGARSAADQATQSRTQRIRAARKAARSRTTMARTVAGSKLRYGAAATRAAVIAAPLAALGMITTPLGRKLGWRWLQAPGLRAYRALTARSKAAHLARVAAAKKRHADNLNPPADPAGTDTKQDQANTPAPIADTVPRAPRTGAAPTLTGDDDPMSEQIHSEFIDASEQLVASASAYEPGGMMHVRMTIRAMAPAIEQWANAFAVLSQKADDDFPLDPAVGEGLEGIHQALRTIVGDAEELAQTFDRVHEADIKRITQPRKSAEAEKTWDTTNNEDYDGE